MPAQEVTDRTEGPTSQQSTDEACPSRKRRRFSVRAFTSLLLTLAFGAMCFSGVMMFLTPRGRVANWTDWSLLGLGKHDWGSVHVNNSVLFVAIAAAHLLLNWSVFMRYLKSKAVSGLNMKKELALASVIAAACVAGPIYDVPPFSSLMALNTDIKNYWERHSEQRAEQPPVPHAEELTLSELAGHVNLTAQQVSLALEDQGYEATHADLTVGQIGEQEGVAPSAVFAVIREHYPDSRGWGHVSGAGGRRGGCDDTESSTCSDGDQEAGEDHGPGAGSGRGRGMGMGRGMGPGHGRGPGGGRGQGMGAGHAGHDKADSH